MRRLATPLAAASLKGGYPTMPAILTILLSIVVRSPIPLSIYRVSTPGHGACRLSATPLVDPVARTSRAMDSLGARITGPSPNAAAILWQHERADALSNAIPTRTRLELSGYAGRNHPLQARAMGPFGPKIERGRGISFPQIAGRGLKIRRRLTFRNKIPGALDIPLNRPLFLATNRVATYSEPGVRCARSILSRPSLRVLSGLRCPPPGKLRTADAFEKIKPLDGGSAAGEETRAPLRKAHAIRGQVVSAAYSSDRRTLVLPSAIVRRA